MPSKCGPCCPAPQACTPPAAALPPADACCPPARRLLCAVGPPWRSRVSGVAAADLPWQGPLLPERQAGGSHKSEVVSGGGCGCCFAGGGGGGGGGCCAVEPKSSCSAWCTADHVACGVAPTALQVGGATAVAPNGGPAGLASPRPRRPPPGAGSGAGGCWGGPVAAARVLAAPLAVPRCPLKPAGHHSALFAARVSGGRQHLQRRNAAQRLAPIHAAWYSLPDKHTTTAVGIAAAGTTTSTPLTSSGWCSRRCRHACLPQSFTARCEHACPRCVRPALRNVVRLLRMLVAAYSRYQLSASIPDPTWAP